jgi:hypothetical protein
MLIKPFLIVLIVMMTCIFDYAVINLTYSEQQLFSHNSININCSTFCYANRNNITGNVWKHSGRTLATSSQGLGFESTGTS